MKKFLKTKIWRIPLIAIIALSVLLVGGGAALASGFILDKTIPSTLTVDIPASANLYTDLACTTPVVSLDFGTITATGVTVTKIVYFKSTVGPVGEDYSATGEIKPSTIIVTSDIDTAVATFMAFVGTPFSAANPDGSHPCMITLSVTSVANGVEPFSIHITGSD